MCSVCHKNNGCGQKNLKDLHGHPPVSSGRRKWLAYEFFPGGHPRRFGVTLSVVPTEFAAEPKTKMKSSKTNFELELFAFTK